MARQELVEQPLQSEKEEEEICKHRWDWETQKQKKEALQIF